MIPSIIIWMCSQDELEKSRHELEDMDMEVAQMKAVSSIKIKKKSEKQKIAVITLKFEKYGFTILECFQTILDGMTNSLYPDQTSSGAVCLPRPVFSNI